MHILYKLEKSSIQYFFNLQMLSKENVEISTNTQRAVHILLESAVR